MSHSSREESSFSSNSSYWLGFMERIMNMSILKSSFVKDFLQYWNNMLLSKFKRICVCASSLWGTYNAPSARHGLHVCMYVRTHMCMHACILVYMYVCMHVHECKHIRSERHAKILLMTHCLCLSKPSKTRTRCAKLVTRRCFTTDLYVYLIYLYIQTYSHIDIHTQVYACIHIHIHHEDTLHGISIPPIFNCHNISGVIVSTISFLCKEPPFPSGQPLLREILIFWMEVPRSRGYDWTMEKSILH